MIRDQIQKEKKINQEMMHSMEILSGKLQNPKFNVDAKHKFQKHLQKKKLFNKMKSRNNQKQIRFTSRNSKKNRNLKNKEKKKLIPVLNKEEEELEIIKKNFRDIDLFKRPVIFYNERPKDLLYIKQNLTDEKIYEFKDLNENTIIKKLSEIRKIMRTDFKSTNIKTDNFVYVKTSGKIFKKTLLEKEFDLFLSKYENDENNDEENDELLEMLENQNKNTDEMGDDEEEELLKLLASSEDEKKEELEKAMEDLDTVNEDDKIDFSGERKLRKKKFTKLTLKMSPKIKKLLISFGFDPRTRESMEIQHRLKESLVQFNHQNPRYKLRLFNLLYSEKNIIILAKKMALVEAKKKHLNLKYVLDKEDYAADFYFSENYKLNLLFNSSGQVDNPQFPFAELNVLKSHFEFFLIQQRKLILKEVFSFVVKNVGIPRKKHILTSRPVTYLQKRLLSEIDFSEENSDNDFSNQFQDEPLFLNNDEEDKDPQPEVSKNEQKQEIEHKNQNYINGEAIKMNQKINKNGFVSQMKEHFKEMDKLGKVEHIYPAKKKKKKIHHISQEKILPKQKLDLSSLNNKFKNIKKKKSEKDEKKKKELEEELDEEISLQKEIEVLEEELLSSDSKKNKTEINEIEIKSEKESSKPEIESLSQKNDDSKEETSLDNDEESEIAEVLKNEMYLNKDKIQPSSILNVKNITVSEIFSKISIRNEPKKDLDLEKIEEMTAEQLEEALSQIQNETVDEIIEKQSSENKKENNSQNDKEINLSEKQDIQDKNKLSSKTISEEKNDFKTESQKNISTQTKTINISQKSNEKIIENSQELSQNKSKKDDESIKEEKTNSEIDKTEKTQIIEEKTNLKIDKTEKTQIVEEKSNKKEIDKTDKTQVIEEQSNKNEIDKTEKTQIIEEKTNLKIDKTEKTQIVEEQSNKKDNSNSQKNLKITEDLEPKTMKDEISKSVDSKTNNNSSVKNEKNSELKKNLTEVQKSEIQENNKTQKNISKENLDVKDKISQKNISENSKKIKNELDQLNKEVDENINKDKDEDIEFPEKLESQEKLDEHLKDIKEDLSPEKENKTNISDEKISENREKSPKILDQNEDSTKENIFPKEEEVKSKKIEEPNSPQKTDKTSNISENIKPITNPEIIIDNKLPEVPKKSTPSLENEEMSQNQPKTQSPKNSQKLEKIDESIQENESKKHLQTEKVSDNSKKSISDSLQKQDLNEDKKDNFPDESEKKSVEDDIEDSNKSLNELPKNASNINDELKDASDDLNSKIKANKSEIIPEENNLDDNKSQKSVDDLSQTQNTIDSSSKNILEKKDTNEKDSQQTLKELEDKENAIDQKNQFENNLTDVSEDEEKSQKQDLENKKENLEVKEVLSNDKEKEIPKIQDDKKEEESNKSDNKSIKTDKITDENNEDLKEKDFKTNEKVPDLETSEEKNVEAADQDIKEKLKILDNQESDSENKDDKSQDSFITNEDEKENISKDQNVDNQKQDTTEPENQEENETKPDDIPIDETEEHLSVEDEVDKAIENIENDAEIIEMEKISGYRPLKITYDMRPIQFFMEKMKMSKAEIEEYLSDLKIALTKMDNIIKTFIKIKDEVNFIDPVKDGKGGDCFREDLKRMDCAQLVHMMNTFYKGTGMPTDQVGPNNVSKQKEIETDVYAVVILQLPNANVPGNVLASAMPGKTDKNNRTIFSAIRINPKNLVFKGKNEIELYSNVMTLLHEVFHSISFSGSIYNKLKKDLTDLNTAEKTGNFSKTKFEKNETNFIFLSKLRFIPNTDPLIDHEHWEPSYLPNDLMIPEERVDAILTIFTLEYIEFVSNNEILKTYRKNLQLNYIAEEITSFDEFFQYKCGNEGEAKFPSFCTKSQMYKKPNGCDASYMFKSKCGTKPLKNGCYENVADKNQNCLAPYIPGKGSKESFESRGFDSRCIESGSGTTSYCMKINIDGDIIKVLMNDGTFIECPKEKSLSIVKVPQKKGKDLEFKCPDVKRFIDYYSKTSCPEMCNGNGFCSNGRCNCFEGYDALTNCKDFKQNSIVTTSFI